MLTQSNFGGTFSRSLERRK